MIKHFETLYRPDNDHDTESESEQSGAEFSDGEINRLLIVTQSHRERRRGSSSSSTSSNISAPDADPASFKIRPIKPDCFERKPDVASRTKITQDMVSIIEDGLYCYEKNLSAALQSPSGKRVRTLSGSSSDGHITLHPKEEFDLLKGSPDPAVKNPSVCPPPPSSTYTTSQVPTTGVWAAGERSRRTRHNSRDLVR